MPEDFNVFTYCQTLSNSDLLSARTIGWTGRWSLFGSFILCCQCLSAQTVDDASHPFKHLPGCVGEQLGNFPWHELKRILADLPPAPPYLDRP